MSMVIGMASTKITVTLPEEQVEAVRRLVHAGRAGSISGFVQVAVATALDDAAGWERDLASLLAASGGPLTDAEIAWADSVLGGGAIVDPS